MLSAKSLTCSNHLPSGLYLSNGWQGGAENKPQKVIAKGAERDAAEKNGAAQQNQKKWVRGVEQAAIMRTLLATGQV